MRTKHGRLHQIHNKKLHFTKLDKLYTIRKLLNNDQFW